MIEKIGGRRVTLAFAVAAIVLGAILRLSSIDLTCPDTDQTRYLTYAFNIAAGRQFPLLGPSVRHYNFYLGPLYYYLLSVPAFLTHSPIAVYQLSPILNSIALLAFYLMARKWWGDQVAILSLVPYALSAPWIIRAHVLTHPIIMPLFIILFWTNLFYLVIERKSFNFIWVCVMMAVLLQLHMPLILYPMTALLILLIFRPPLKPRYVVSGLGLFILLLLPYLIYEFGSGFENTHKLLKFVFGQFQARQRAHLDLISTWKAIFAVSPRLLTEFGTVSARNSVIRGLSFSEPVLVVAGIAIVLSRLVRCTVRSSITRETQAYFMLLLWFVPALILPAAARFSVPIYYLDFAYPAPFIFLGISLDALVRTAARLPSKLKRIPVSVVSFYLILLSSLQLTVLLRFRSDIAKYGIGRMPSFAADIMNISAWPKERLRYFVTMALRYRKALAEYFIVREGLSYEECARELHGLYSECFWEDSGFWVSWYSRRTPLRPGNRDTTLNYLLEQRLNPIRPVPRAVSHIPIGAFNVIAYTPPATFRSWIVEDSFNGTAHPVEIPTRFAWLSAPLESPLYPYWVPGIKGRGRSAFLEGVLDFDSGANTLSMCVNIRSAHPVVVRQAWLNQEELVPCREESLRMITLVREYCFDLKGHIRRGPNQFRIKLSSRRPVACDIDVYCYGYLPDATAGNQ